MSIINSDGLNTNWQLNVLNGLQSIVNGLQQNSSGDTTNIENLLTTIISGIQSGIITKTHDGLGASITSTEIGSNTALDVNLVGGVALEVNLDQNNDQVQIFGSDTNAPVSTNSSGRLQVDIFSIPEVEIKNDNANPLPVSGTVSVSGTVAASQSGTWNINNISGNISLPTGAATESTLNTLNSKFTVETRTPSLIRVTNAGTIPAGAKSISFFNAGNTPASILGGSNNLLPGESFEFSAGGLKDTLTACSYDALGTTTLVITSII